MDRQRVCSEFAGLEMSIAIEGVHVVISLHGEIDADNAGSLLPVAAGVVARDQSLRIDFTDVTFMDSSVLRQLLVCEACLGRDGVDVKLRNVSGQVRQVLERAHLSHLIETDESGHAGPHERWRVLS
jgi:anti-anti-sigma factor